jgi:hypothetical protein
MSRMLLPVVLAFSLVVAVGCGRKKSPVASAPAPTQTPAARSGGGGGSAIPRVDLRVKSQNNLKQIGIGYSIALTTGAPRSIDDLKASLEGADKLLASPVDEQPYEIVWGVEPSQVPTGSSETLLAWEKTGDKNGSRNVLMADCKTVRLVSAAEFEKLPKAKGR